MATRRIVNQEKTHLDQDDSTATPASNTSPAVPSSVIAKLLIFTLAMVVLPIGSYFVTRDYLFKGNATYAGAFAALTANVVLIAYVIVAFQDDQAEREDLALKEKKEGKEGKKAQ